MYFWTLWHWLFMLALLMRTDEEQQWETVFACVDRRKAAPKVAGPRVFVLLTATSGVRGLT